MEDEKSLANLFDQNGVSSVLKGIPEYYLQASNVDRRLVNKLSLAGKKILNVGCSSYLFSDIYFALKGADVTSIDIDRGSINTANEKLLKLSKTNSLANLHVMWGDGRDLCFPENTFDIVVSFSAIEHMEDHADRLNAIREMVRVVKPGGYVVVTGPNLLNLPVTILSRQLFKRIGEYEHRYTPWELKEILQKSGLTVDEFDSESVYIIDKDLIAMKYPSLSGIPLAVFKPLSIFMWAFNEAHMLKILGMRMGFRARKPE